MQKTMRRVFTFLSFFACVVGFSLLPQTASASDFRNFHGTLAGAWPHYREADFYLRTGNPGVALFELEQWRDKWRSLVMEFAASPPDVYADDPAWASTLREIEALSSKGLAEAGAGNLKEARKTLEPIRQLLASTRQRNHVIIFSDHVDRANAAFEQLFAYRHTPPAFDDIDQLDAFRRHLAITTNAYQQVMDNAPAPHLENSEFQRLMKQSFYSLGRLWVAIKEKNQQNLINILRELRSSDRMLFLRFG